MSAPQIPNLLSLRGGPRSRGSRGRGRGSTRPGDPAVSSQQRHDLAIQSTDTDAAVSRLSAVSLGYLDDPFACYLVSGPGTRRLPIINRGTYTRTTALDILIDAFLAPLGAAHADTQRPPQTKQIISLGAGTDTRYFRLRAQNKHQNLIYHEFDFPSVSRSKLQLVSGNEALANQDPSTNIFVRPFKSPTGDDQHDEWGFAGPGASSQSEVLYCCHSLDLRQLPYAPSLKSLEDIHGLRGDIPTLVISECCLCYLEVDIAKDVVRWFADRIPSLGMILYEPVRVDDPFGQMMVANLAARNVTMPTVKVYKSLVDQKQRMSDLGFKQTEEGGGQEAESVERIWENWITPEEKERVDALEGLDEVEEWQMLARHYAVIWGWRGSSGWESWKSFSQK